MRRALFALFLMGGLAACAGEPVCGEDENGNEIPPCVEDEAGGPGLEYCPGDQWSDESGTLRCACTPDSQRYCPSETLEVTAPE